MALNWILGTAHVMVPVAMLSCGILISGITCAVATDVQPLEPVVVSVYVPVCVTDGLGRVEAKPPGPLHANDAPAVGDPPVMVPEVMVQVSVSPVAVAPGGMIFCKTLYVKDAVQPL